MAWIYHFLFIHSSVDGHLGCLYFLAIMDLPLDSQFCSIDLYVYPYASPILLLFSSFVVSFEIRNWRTLFLFKFVLAILYPLNFHMNF